MKFIIYLNHAVSEFHSEVGLSYLKGMHLNDSKASLGSRKDRHENIGLCVFHNLAAIFYLFCCCFSGQLGISVFRHIVSDSRTQNIPLILETPMFDATEIWKKEISTLNCLSKLADGGKVSETEMSLVEEITSLVRNRATNKGAKASKTRARKRDIKEEEEHDSGCA